MSVADSERVGPGHPPASALAVSVGGCPLCGRPAVWAFTGRESPDRVLLEPDSGVRLSAGSGRTVVVPSAAGQLRVTEAYVYWLHVCDPNVVTSSVGDYTVAILTHTCPVESCSAPPGEFCVSPRYEVLPRPHGARVAISSGSPWTDDDQFGAVVLDE